MKKQITLQIVIIVIGAMMVGVNSFAQSEPKYWEYDDAYFSFKKDRKIPEYSLIKGCFTRGTPYRLRWDGEKRPDGLTYRILGTNSYAEYFEITDTLDDDNIREWVYKNSYYFSDDTKLTRFIIEKCCKQGKLSDTLHQYQKQFCYDTDGKLKYFVVVDDIYYGDEHPATIDVIWYDKTNPTKVIQYYGYYIRFVYDELNTKYEVLSLSNKKSSIQIKEIPYEEYLQGKQINL